MTLLCVPIFVHDLAQGKRDVSLAAEAGADIVELRVDQFSDAKQLQELIAACPVPTIVTCRPHWEGGECRWSDEARFELIGDGVKGAATYVDVELKSLSNQPARWAARDARPGLIVSAHDFMNRPDRLYNILRDLAQSPGDVSKIVWMARTIRDNLEVFEILQNKTKPTIALCMGEPGLISRVLAKKFGAFLSFASLHPAHATAPGQVTIADMKRLYRWDALGPATRVYGVIGSPVAHSMSPAVHNAGFEETKFDGVYLPLLVNEGYESFKAFMESFVSFNALDLCGLSITIPHKENALRYLQGIGAEVEPLAASIGAVNTIVIDRSTPRPSLRGFSSDYAAILDSITSKLAISRDALADYRVAVLGAGGTGRTAVAALAHCGATVVVYNRTVERAQALADEFNGNRGKVVAAKFEKLCDSRCQIYLNTTSVGMHPKVDHSPIDVSPPKWTADTLVFDTVYNPMKTKLLGQAESAGAQTINGVEMFVRQAAAQFEAWTNKPAPIATMRAVIEARLK